MSDRPTSMVSQQLLRGAVVLLGSSAAAVTSGCLAGLLHLAGDRTGTRFLIGVAALATIVAGLTAFGLILHLIRLELRRETTSADDPK